MCFLFIGDFMYEKLSKKITKSLIQHSFVSENDAEIYIYSFQIILSTLVSSVFIRIWAFLFKQVLNTIIFLLDSFYVENLVVVIMQKVKSPVLYLLRLFSFHFLR